MIRCAGRSPALKGRSAEKQQFLYEKWAHLCGSSLGQSVTYIDVFSVEENVSIIDCMLQFTCAWRGHIVSRKGNPQGVTRLTRTRDLKPLFESQIPLRILEQQECTNPYWFLKLSVESAQSCIPRTTATPAHLLHSP